MVAERAHIAVATVIKADGTKVDVPFLGDRFDHVDIAEGPPTLRFQEMNGWILLKALVPIILFYRPYCIVEIGAGASTTYFAREAEKYGVKLYSCDKSPRKNVVLFKDHIFVQKFSKDFIEEFDDTPSIVLIDADHAYEVAKMEFEFFFEKLVPGGVIFLHDTMPPSADFLESTACHDVYKLRQDLEKRDDLDCFTWPYTAGFCGLTMVIKKEEGRPFWEL